MSYKDGYNIILDCLLCMYGCVVCIYRDAKPSLSILLLCFGYIEGANCHGGDVEFPANESIRNKATWTKSKLHCY